MPPLEEFSDDAVAEQLKKEAKQNSIKYSALGVDAFLPKKPANPTLKPNTRFLKAIIKEANSHNAALRKRNASHDGAERSPRLSRNEGGAEGDSRHRARFETGLAESEGSRSQRHRRGSGSAGEDQHQREHRDRHGRSSRHGRSRSPHRKRDRSHDRSHDRERRRGHRARSPERESKSSEHRKRRHHKRSRSPSPREKRDKLPDDRNRSSEKRRSRSPENKICEASNDRQEDSDPLEQIIKGPSKSQQPVPRGRGANKARSQMDEHFSAGYNPAMDVQPDSADEDDWDQALEALRDRQRWKELGANRLKDAGFSDREVKKWERGGEQLEEDIRWKHKGEGREWDRGKVMTASGEVETPAKWPS